MGVIVKAVIATRPGPLSEVLEVRTLPALGRLGPGEVLVRMLAGTINPSDEVTVSGAYSSRTSFPFVPGFEGVGVVEEVGSSVPRAAKGLRVLPIGSPGAWGEYKRTSFSWCVPIPESLTVEAACFAYINPLTAYLMVDKHCHATIRHVAISAATSTIAHHLAELLNERGIQPVGLVRGTPGRTVAQPGLWNTIVDTSSDTWPQQLKDVTSGQLDVAFDCVGGHEGSALHRMLAPQAKFVHYGLLSGQPLNTGAPTSGRAIEMFRLRDIIHTVPIRDLPRLFEPVFDRLERGRLHTPVAARIPLSALPRHAGLGQRPPGKILLSHDF